MIKKQPAYFIFHGGGPCFFMDWDPPHTWDGLRGWLESVPSALPETPKAIVVVTAHWEEAEFTVSSAPKHDLLYDYSGFPGHTYALKYDAVGDASLAQQIQSLAQSAGIACQLDAKRGWDHGVFIPLKVMFPEADIPVVALSLKKGLNPLEHIAMGKVLESLREQGVLIFASGASYHNLRGLFSGNPKAVEHAKRFDVWLNKSVTSHNASQRQNALEHWRNAPYAQDAHPREEHLLPLMVMVGAAGNDAITADWQGDAMGFAFSCFKAG
jgi:aromatic ring-opening dioxygenase catalytic subunit (LigB family)